MVAWGWAEPLRLGQYAVEKALAAVDRVERDGAVAAEYLVEIDVAFAAQRIDPIFEKLAHSFDAFEAGEHELVLACRRIEAGNVFVLRKSSHSGKLLVPLPCGQGQVGDY